MFYLLLQETQWQACYELVMTYSTQRSLWSAQYREDCHQCPNKESLGTIRSCWKLTLIEPVIRTKTNALNTYNLSVLFTLFYQMSLGEEYNTNVRKLAMKINSCNRTRIGKNKEESYWSIHWSEGNILNNIIKNGEVNKLNSFEKVNKE